jgi:hypothetical protein
VPLQVRRTMIAHLWLTGLKKVMAAIFGAPSS